MPDHDSRRDELEKWVKNTLNQTDITIESASEDASFRRYFRATANDDVFIVMDAPPDKEPIEPFLSAAEALYDNGVHVPQVFAVNTEQGFMLIEDLGVTNYLDELKHAKISDDHATIKQLYSAALHSLLSIQNTVNIDRYLFERYDEQKLNIELEVFTQWYLAQHLGITFNSSDQLVWQKLKAALITACLEQPQTWVHRDFHSRNLMVTKHASPGVIDFQDLVIGPITYDLASIFKDCYIDWPRTQQLEWLKEYLSLSEYSNSVGFQQLIRWYDFTGLQRHLKVLGVFCRLNYRDGKTHYVNDLPLVRQYIFETLSLYPEFSEFSKFFNNLAHY